MTSSRVPPVPPDKNVPNDKNAPSPHRKVVKVEKIEKVSEVDEDQTRARKFREMVEQPEETPSEHPTPFDLFTSATPSTSDASTSESETGETADSSAAYSQAPSASSPAPSTGDEEEGAAQAPAPPSPPSVSSPGVYAGEGEEEEEPPLPQSPGIWANIDEPPDTIAAGPSFQEMPRSAARVFGPAQPDNSGKTGKPGAYFSPADAQGKEAKASGRGAFMPPEGYTTSSPFGVPGKPISPTAAGKKAAEREAALPPAFSYQQQTGGYPKKMGEEPPVGKGRLPEAPGAQTRLPVEKGPAAFQESLVPEGTPSARMLQKGEMEKDSTSSSYAEKKTAAVQKGKESAVKKAGRESAAPSRPSSKEKDISPISQKQEREGQEQKKKPKEEEALQLTSPSLTQLNPESIPVAQAAATAATPYLGPEALAVYFHMIGTIVAMVAPSGDSRTEFILNAPSFANSKFFGSTITIEKFATAPDALNIRLTGSTEAVNAFNENIPNLLAAFRRGKFAFVINRIEAAYEKPLFRRKEGARDKGLGGKQK